MSRHTADELRRLLARLEAQCSRVLSHLEATVCLLGNADRSKARQLVLDDQEINREEVHLEEDALRIVALHQPVGSDLRLIAAVLKFNNDLERAADHATNVLRDLERLPSPDLLPPPMLLLASQSLEACRKAVRAWIQRDRLLAQEVCRNDHVIDTLENAVQSAARALAVSNPACVDQAFLLARSAHDLERVADLAVNLAESALHLETGEIVRHR